MPTISPSYSMKGVSNPYYTMDPSVTTVAKNALKNASVTLFSVIDAKSLVGLISNSTSKSFVSAL